MVGARRSADRSRATERAVTRRRLLAGAVAVTGLGSLLPATGAVSQLEAGRNVALGVASDQNAVVGLAPAATVDAGETGQTLVSVTNNADTSLTVSVTLQDASHGTVSPSSTSITSGDAATFSVDVDADAPGGDDALAFDVEATDGDEFTATMGRSVGVRTIERSLEDRTQNSNAAFSLAYGLVNVDSFDSVEVTVRNLGPSRDDLPTRTYSSTNAEDVIDVPAAGSDGGAEGDEYEFVKRVYESDGTVALERTFTDVADGSDPGDNDEFGGGENDPQLDSVTVTDETDNQTDQTAFDVDYAVTNTSEFGDVRVTFDNAGNDWSDEATTSDQPSDTIHYPRGGGTQGGTGGDTYEITVEVRNENGLTTDSRTVTDAADGTDPS